MTLKGAAAEYISKEYGGSFEEADETITVATTVTRIIGNDPDAVALVIINLSTNSAYVSPDNKPSSTHGIFLGGGGGSVSMNVRDDLSLPTREWWGVGDGGNADLYYVRIRRFSRGS